ncbi:Peptidase A1 [Corchorus olitorius]|uniref:Peptidase A1 n=1 Tax=Corchorus olitorius TaxID=93759 RepID=A0A1R3J740_9ROSI|nr:Peptidase A1 [Corchorus olitorius]
MFLQDERRVKAINSRIHHKTPVTGKMVQQVPVTASEYFVKVGFGSPPKYFSLIIDTGSAITWVPCQTCSPNLCPKKDQNSMLYNPFDSSTSSSNVSCSYSNCKYYNQTYFDGSYAAGSFMLDKVTIGSYVFPNFVFLCANQSWDSGGDQYQGILALGKDSTEWRTNAYSLISQTESKTGNVFCHCLPSTQNSADLYFGKNALDKCDSGSYTPLKSSHLYYHVNLTAITIGAKRLEISPALTSSSSRTIIDSGTVISRLPSSVYSNLKSEFKAWMSKYPPAQPPENGTLDTCYNLQGHDDSALPPMVLHFQGLDVTLDKTAVYWKENGGMSQVCLAFADTDEEVDGYTIIGNHQLQKLNVLYDIQNQRIGIGPGNC